MKRTALAGFKVERTWNIPELNASVSVCISAALRLCDFALKAGGSKSPLPLGCSVGSKVLRVQPASLRSFVAENWKIQHKVAKSQRGRGVNYRGLHSGNGSLVIIGMTENEISKAIVDAAVEVHRELGGPGLIEDVYEEALSQELFLRGLKVERQRPVPIIYKGKTLHRPLRLDMRVENLVLVDNKAVSQWNPIFEAQMLTYLRLTKLRLGLVINFGERLVSGGIHRVINGLPENFHL